MSSVADLLTASILATRGWLMTPLPLLLVSGVLAGAVAFVFALDLAKVSVLRRLKIA